MHNGGSDWSAWPAYLSFFDRVAGLGLPVYEKWRHYEQAALNGASRIMHEEFCIVSDRHVEVHVETVDGVGRLHHDGGAARRWADGFAIHAWHGTVVPADFWTWDVARALSERNDEVRRAAIERIGWHEFLNGLTLVSESDDPGNEGMKLSLFDLNSAAGRRLLGDEEWEALPRLIVMDNASLDRGGHRRRYSRLVPGETTDPVAGIAASYGITRDAYARLETAK